MGMLKKHNELYIHVDNVLKLPLVHKKNGVQYFALPGHRKDRPNLITYAEALERFGERIWIG